MASSQVGRYSLVILCFISIIQAGGITDVPGSQWQQLNQTVNGKLQLGRPMNLPCFTRYDNGSGIAMLQVPDLPACSAVNSVKTSGAGISSYFGGYHVPNWGQCVANSQACAISVLLPVDPVSPLLQTCYQGSIPSYYIDCRQVSDLQRGLKFATENRLPVVIKNTGHDHRGRSSGPSTFALWTHNIKPPLRLDTQFKPEGCTIDAGPSLTYGAGHSFGEIYDHLRTKGYMMVGGASRSVGASGGWLMGGGHGALVNSYGLGVDNVIQMKVVLPDGRYVTANRCQNQDLFFALRGGGGGTFGIVTETTSKLHQTVAMQYVSISFGHLGMDGGSKYLSLLIDNAPRWAEEGWGGYILPGLLGGTIGTFAAITPKLTLQQAKDSMKPIVDFAKSLSKGNVAVEVNITTLPNGYHDFLQTPTADTVGGFDGLSYALVSRLVPRSNFANASKAELLSTLSKLVQNGKPNPAVPFYILMVTPAAYQLPQSDRSGGPGYASVTPAWRDSLWQLVMPALWDPIDPTAAGAGGVNQAFTNAHYAIDPLRAITPSSGAYLNEADVFEPTPEQSFWGRPNYDRLLKIKKQVDPTNLLTCWNCIGWEPSDPRYRCYPRLTR